MDITPGGIKSVSVFDVNSSTVVQVDAVRGFEYSEEDQYFTTGNGLRRIVGTRRIMSFECLDHDSVQILKDWADSTVDVNAVAIGLSHNVQFYEDSFVNIVPITSSFGANNAYRVDVVNTLRDASAYTNANLAWYKGWNDSTATGVPDGYSEDDSAANMAVTFNATSFEATVDVDFDSPSQYGWLYTEIPIPVAGAQVTASCEAGTFQEVQTSTFQMEVKAYNYAKSSVLAATSVTFPGTARRGVTLTLPDDTYYVRLGPSIQAGTFSYTTPTQVVQTFKFPALRVDGGTQETKY